jgi:hypothetical protein
MPESCVPMVVSMTGRFLASFWDKVHAANRAVFSFSAPNVRVHRTNKFVFVCYTGAFIVGKFVHVIALPVGECRHREFSSHCKVNAASV